MLPIPIPFAPDGGALPVVSDADVAEVEPYFIRESDSAPVRDAIRAALRVMLFNYQTRARYAAAQSDDTRATGIYLDGLGRDVGVFKKPGEEPEPYRARVLQSDAFVTPTAILAAVGSILAPHTSILPQYCESVLDRWFVGDGTQPWSSHIYDRETVDVGFLNPKYPDRLYPADSAENEGFVRPQSQPRGAIPGGDEEGRWLMIRIPDVAAVDNASGFVFTATGPSDPDVGFCVEDGTSAVALMTNYLFEGSFTESGIYDAIINAVERIRAHGLRWTLYVDPLLT